MLKPLIKAGLRSCGYELRRLGAREADALPVPFVRDFDIGGRRFSMWITTKSADKWYRQDGWARAGEAAELLRLAAPGSRVLEVGSHHGFTTLLLATAVGPEGFVLGLEAFPQNAIVAQAQAQLNKLGACMHVLPAAGADRDGKLAISMSHNSQVTSTASAVSIEVSALTGDGLDQVYGPFDLVKIDVEGFEERVLRGCRAILARRPKLALELHLDDLPLFGAAPQAVFDLIGIHDYRGTMVVRPDFETVRKFDPAALPDTGVANLFLEPL